MNEQNERVNPGDLVIPAGPGLPLGLVIDADELTERFSRSGGPGGQSVNTTDSRVELTWDIAESAALSDAQRDRLLAYLAARLVGGALTIAASEQRSQLRNRQAARARLVALIREAMVPVTRRRPTRPSRAAKQRRLDAKKQRGELKSTRGQVRPD
ncbi:MAG TPA: alternative ribosome rescue aminoacyl-tRNA hydrolase ArfB [Jatrophihabitantaceae bacterium]|jgi:ribosome-associated protein|nr:alternative ribosome rescue aminoacyl-tRNA hydrolase ArfB [Jatrophihabitantaceae bacterium]